jgi:hypothetical protein
MKADADPITEDEWLLRLIWKDRVTQRVPVISPNAFEPRDNETGGISFYRLACLNDPADALLPIHETKRDSYAIVKVPVSLMTEFTLHVRSDPRQDVPGHVVVPELNSTDYKANKSKFATIKLRLAEMASANIVRYAPSP